MLLGAAQRGTDTDRVVDMLTNPKSAMDLPGCDDAGAGAPFPLAEGLLVGPRAERSKQVAAPVGASGSGLDNRLAGCPVVLLHRHRLGAHRDNSTPVGNLTDVLHRHAVDVSRQLRS